MNNQEKGLLYDTNLIDEFRTSC